MAMIARGQLGMLDMNDVVAQATAPINPTDGALWYNTIDKKLYVYSGSTWNISSDYEKYVQSRGENLVTNGTGLLGNNTNFSQFTFDGSEVFAGAGSFFTNAQNSTKFNDEFIPVDPSRKYRGSYMAKGTTGLGHQYGGFVPYDIDRNVIDSNKMIAHTYPVVTLAQELKVGDTKIWLSSLDGFTDASGNNSHVHSLVMWGYKNSYGYEYPVSTYSRLYFGSAWLNGAINVAEKSITFSKPFNVTNPSDANGIFRVGHQLSKTTDGSGYLYTMSSNVKYPTTWTKFEGMFDGVGLGSNKFPHGTAFLKILFLTNRSTSGGTAGDSFWLSSLSFSDVTDIEGVKSDVADMMSDLKITPLEKQTLSRVWEEIKAEQSQLILRADAVGVIRTVYNTAFTALDTTTPRIQLDILASMTTTYTLTIATRDAFKTQLNTYLNEAEKLKKAITDKLDGAVTAIELTLGNMANDNILDFAERQIVKDKVSDIIGYVIADATTALPTTTVNDAGTSGKGTFYNVRKSAVMAGLSVTDASYVAVATTYNALKTYLEAMTPVDAWDVKTATQTSNITVVKATFRTNWLNYYKSELDLITATAERLKKNVDDVEVGGANYASNGNFGVIDLTKPLWSASYEGQTKEVVDISVEKPPFKYAYHVKNTTNALGGIFTPTLWDGLIAEAMVDKQITISFWLKYQNIVVGASAFNSGRFGELIIEGTTATATKVYSYPRFATPTTTTEVAYIAGTNMVWAKYSATFKMSLPVTAIKLSKIQFKHGLENCTGEFWTTGIMIETGNKASDWSHSPLDLQERLTNVEFKITDSEILSTVTSSDDYINLKAQSSATAGAITSKVTQTEINASIANDNQIKDTRGTNELPSYYWTNFPRRTIEEFKTRATIGVTVGTATYGNMTTEIPWTDVSGGAIKQTFASADGTFERRGISTTTWSAWVQVENTAGSQAKIDAFNTSTVAPLATRVSSAETKITPTAIVSTVTQSTDYIGLKGRVDTAETKITPTAITNTVTSSATYINAMGEKVATNAVVSSINQTAEAIKINASKIDITGAVTFSSFDTSTKGVLSNSNGAIINDNPIFLDWTSTNPVGYSATAVVGLSKVASGNGMGNSVQFVVGAGGNHYLTPTQVTTHPYYQYIVVEFIFNMTSGTVDGAGVLLRYEATTDIDNLIAIKSSITAPVLNKWYTVTKTIKVASATQTAGFTGYSIYPMGGYTGFGTVTAKTIQFDSLKVRSATEQEINAFETDVSVTTKTATWDRAGNINSDGTFNATKLSGTVSDIQVAGGVKWNTASTNALDAKTSLADIASDLKVTPVEKNNLKTTWEAMKAEYTQLTASATEFGVSSTNYVNAYNAIVNTTPKIELEVLLTMTTTYTFISDTARNNFRSQFNAYFTQAETLQNAIRAKIKADTASAKSVADNAYADTTRWKFSGKTTIDGGDIETDTITAVQIKSNSVTTNELLISNPNLISDVDSFEQYKGRTPNGSSSLLSTCIVTDEEAFHGTYSLKTISNGANSYKYLHPTLDNGDGWMKLQVGKQYMISAYVKTTSTVATTVNLAFAPREGKTSTTVAGSATAIKSLINTDGWVRVFILSPVIAGTNPYASFYVRNVATSITTYWDAIQIEEYVAGNIEPSGFSSGGTTILDGSNIRTKTVLADAISVTSLQALSANLGTMTAGTINTLQINGASSQIYFGSSSTNFDGRIDYATESFRFQADASTYIKVNKGGSNGFSSSTTTSYANIQLYSGGSPMFNFGVTDATYRHRTLTAGNNSIKFLNGSIEQIQFRNASDTEYTEIIARDILSTRAIYEDGNRVAKEKQFASGYISINPVANTPTSYWVYYGKTFSAIPAISVSANTTVPGAIVQEVSFSGATTTGFYAWLYRSSSSSTGVSWFATDIG